MNRRHIWTIATIGLLVTAAVWWPHTKAASQAPASSASESVRPDPEAKLEQQTQALVQQYRNADDEEEREAVMDDLETVVSRHFDLRHETRERELEELEREIERLRFLHERREAEKDRIVQQRVDSLLREADGLGWGSPSASSVRSLDGPTSVDQTARPRKEVSVSRIDSEQREELEREWLEKLEEMAESKDEEEMGKELHTIARDLNARFEAGELTAMEAFVEACRAGIRRGDTTEEKMENMAESLAKLSLMTEGEAEKAWREWFAEVLESKEEEERSEESKDELREAMYAIARDLNAQFEAGELTAREAFEEAAKAALKLGADEEELAEKLAKVRSLTDEELEKAWRDQIARMPDSKEKDD